MKKGSCSGKADEKLSRSEVAHRFGPGRSLARKVDFRKDKSKSTRHRPAFSWKALTLTTPRTAQCEIAR